MVGMSLRTTLENWDCEHKKIDGDDFNYDLYRHSKSELSDLELLYIEYDVLGLAEYLMKKWDSIKYRNNKRPSLWKMPLTVTGEPRKAIKDESEREEHRVAYRLFRGIRQNKGQTFGQLHFKRNSRKRPLPRWH